MAHQRRSTKLRAVGLYVASTRRGQKRSGVLSTVGVLARLKDRPTYYPAGEFHGALRGADRALCGYPVVALHTFEQTSWTKDTTAACAQCIEAAGLYATG